MTWLESQRANRNKCFKIGVVIFILIVGVIIGVYLFKEDSVDNTIELKEYQYLNFESDKLVLSDYQDERDNIGIVWEMEPKQVKRKAPIKLNIIVKNEGKASRIWGARERNILLEKYEDGNWYYSKECFPKLTGEEVERSLLPGASRIYRFILNEDIEAGQYRFTALFKNGISAMNFDIE